MRKFPAILMLSLLASPALDIARVDAASAIGEPERVLPALMASEHAMPTNYSASLRVAEMAVDAKRFDDTLAACDLVSARSALVDALAAACEIGNAQNRDRNVHRIEQALADHDHAPK